MTKAAIIGGTGLASLQGLGIVRQEQPMTPYGVTSAPLLYGRFRDTELVFLARHGTQHRIPPHRINYRANMWALRESGVNHVIAIAAVGGIRADLGPGRLVVPDQIIDYTWGRGHTFFEDKLEHVVHVDFTEPYCSALRDILLRAGRAAHLDLVSGGTYGATQGPRLETAAEIARLERDGCDIVGMTGMPETVLARELDLCYAACAVVGNAAAGRSEEEIRMSEIEANLRSGMEKVQHLLESAITLL
jgi:5'-methylthioinosine phosphorylase